MAQISTIIEFDGDPHGDPGQVWKDTIRDKYLEEFGYTVLRFENRI
jgi:very-short-patch-repair endonuclease